MKSLLWLSLAICVAIYSNACADDPFSGYTLKIRTYDSGAVPVYQNVECEAVRSDATGFFRVQKIDGRWWFIDPSGHGFFMRGVNQLHPLSPSACPGFKQMLRQKYAGDKVAYIQDTTRLIRKLGFNAAGIDKEIHFLPEEPIVFVTTPALMLTPEAKEHSDSFVKLAVNRFNGEITRAIKRNEPNHLILNNSAWHFTAPPEVRNL